MYVHITIQDKDNNTDTSIGISITEEEIDKILESIKEVDTEIDTVVDKEECKGQEKEESDKVSVHEGSRFLFIKKEGYWLVTPMYRILDTIGTVQNAVDI